MTSPGGAKNLSLRVVLSPTLGVGLWQSFVRTVWTLLFGNLPMSSPVTHVRRSLEMFSGSGNWSTAMASLGYETIRHDFNTGVDIMMQGYVQAVTMALELGLISVLVIACECTTFSRANTKHASSQHCLFHIVLCSASLVFALVDTK